MIRSFFQWNCCFLRKLIWLGNACAMVIIITGINEHGSNPRTLMLRVLGETVLIARSPAESDPRASQLIRESRAASSFNESSIANTTFACVAGEKTPGYITTVFLSNPPFTFGCLSKDASSSYFSVVFSSANFPNTPVWVANRYHPVKDNASLSIEANGSLILQDADGAIIWTTASSSTHPKPSTLSLTNTGNLILLDQQGLPLWESFAEPVDVLVPAQFLNPGGILVAGFSSHVSSTGSFTAVMNPGGLVFYENSTSKPLPFYALTYPLIPTTVADVMASSCNHTQLQLTQLNLTQVQLTDSPLCKNVTSVTPVSQMAVSFGSPVVFVRLEPTGVLKGYYPDHKPSFDAFQNLGKGLCGIPNVCGPYGICATEGSLCTCPGNASDSQLFTQTKDQQFLLSSIACTPRFPPVVCVQQGGQHYTDSNSFFLDVERVDYFANDFISATILANSLEQCKVACAADCRCQAAFYRAKSKQCFLHESVMSMIRVGNDDFMASIKMQKQSASSRAKGLMIIGITMAAIVCVLICFCALIRWYYYQYRRKAAHGHRTLSKDEDELLASLPFQPKRFTFKELQAATRDFSQRLGAGGFGSVYKGMLPDGSSVAVKQLENSTSTKYGLKEFRNEVIALTNINHQNLVHLRGFCASGPHRLLVYEYVSNGSLDTWLFGQKKGPGSRPPAAGGAGPLDLKRRLAIAIHTARALVFLHEQCRIRIVHLDVKPQNILLDEHFIPKLSDFGLSRLINEDNDSAVSRMRGTPGYMAPECLILTDATEKSDVYSFGMVLLEIVSGRKNVDVSRLVVQGDEEGWYFPALAARKFKEGRIGEIVDQSLVLQGRPHKQLMEEVSRVMQIAFWCIQDEPGLRPTMGNALLMLEGYCPVTRPPLSFTFGMRVHLSNSLASSMSNPRISSRSSIIINTYSMQQQQQVQLELEKTIINNEEDDDDGSPTHIHHHRHLQNQPTYTTLPPTSNSKQSSTNNRAADDTEIYLIPRLVNYVSFPNYNLNSRQSAHESSAPLSPSPARSSSLSIHGASPIIRHSPHDLGVPRASLKCS